MIHLKTKKEVDWLLKANNMINIIFDKNNNQTSDRILNITIFTKDHEFFHAFSKSTGALKLNGQITVAEIFEKIV